MGPAEIAIHFRVHCEDDARALAKRTTDSNGWPRLTLDPNDELTVYRTQIAASSTLDARTQAHMMTMRVIKI